MQKAAYSRDIRPEFRCVLSADCIESVRMNAYEPPVISNFDMFTLINSAGEK